jgi:hypothetical protein
MTPDIGQDTFIAVKRAGNVHEFCPVLIAA